MNNEELVKLSLSTREYAYVPYSKFKVGAALEMDDGKIYTGVNIENGSYSATNCAERTAIFKAISEGGKRIKKIAISSDSSNITFPCGICRQVITEFSDENTVIICSNVNGDYKEYKLKELFPYPFEF